ncbi:MAG TPA: tripartite tricarboxylate transporter substrate binding protein [Pseudolabrys sp.]|jgi:tripartite-type tricarboxylate transporter receptor subunit TctC|nr:tripartite tricarboxylate transporter substrate binding protein [Pseudolabrys sp.]
MIRLVGVFLIAVLAFVPQRPSSADETYPTRPIRLIVGFAAGSSGDVAARIVSHKLGDLLGQTVIVENRPGASSMIATDYVARSAKDGYTLLFATIAATINTTLMPSKGANFEKDMAPIVLVGSIPNILVVNPDLGVNTVKELIALAKQKPDELLYGASGLGSGPHLATELFKQMAGIKMTGVLYPGSGQTVMDLISGRIQVMFSPASTVLAFIKDGRVRALATTESKRTNAAPELPTISEAALPGYDAGLWFGILGPAGMPKPIIDKISNAANSALKDPDVLKQLTTQGLDARGGSPEEFALFIKNETDRWARVIRQMDAAKDNKEGAARHDQERK